jgi:hypothetical protein
MLILSFEQFLSYFCDRTMSINGKSRSGKL